MGVRRPLRRCAWSHALTTLDADVPASRIAWSRTRPARVGDGEERGYDGQPGQSPVGEDRLDRDMITPGDERRDAAQDASRMLGRRLEGHPRLVVATAGEALLALAAGLVRPCTCRCPDLRLDQGLPGQPGDGEAALADEQPPSVRRPARDSTNGATDGGPSYGRSKGGARRRSSRRWPTRQEPPASTAENDNAVPGAEVLDPARKARRRHDADARHVRRTS